MAKQLYVSSAVQAALLRDILIPAFSNGFWQHHRPAGHGAAWNDVEILVSDTDFLGPVDFTVPRLYNFINPEFLDANEAALVISAKAVKSTSNLRSVKKELGELSHIVGGRLTSKSGVVTKLFRGQTNHPNHPDNKKTFVNTVVKKTDGAGSETRRITNE